MVKELGEGGKKCFQLAAGNPFAEEPRKQPCGGRKRDMDGFEHCGLLYCFRQLLSSPCSVPKWVQPIQICKSAKWRKADKTRPCTKDISAGSQGSCSKAWGPSHRSRSIGFVFISVHLRYPSGSSFLLCQGLWSKLQFVRRFPKGPAWQIILELQHPSIRPLGPIIAILCGFGCFAVSLENHSYVTCPKPIALT